MYRTTIALVAAAALGLSAASAATAQQTPAATQTTPEATTQTAPDGTMTAPPASADPSTAAQAASAGTVSASDIAKFAAAYVAVQKINADASVTGSDKQTRMASAVSGSGLTAERFNAIGTAISTDPALQAKVGAAVQAAGPAAGKN